MGELTDAVRLGVDVGGTFTDVVLLTEEGITTAKTPTTEDQSEGVLRGIELACERAGIDPDDVDGFDHATTVSVNALLERDGAETVLVTTEGFRDVLAIGRQARPDLYDLAVERADPLVPRRRRITVDERTTVDASPDEPTEEEPNRSSDDGTGKAALARPVDEAELPSLVDRIGRIDPDAVAVSFLHSYADPANERTVVAYLREALDVPVSASHEVLGTFREYERTATTVADAYVTPIVDAYLDRLVERAADRGLPEPTVMQAHGGVAPAAIVRNRAVTTVFSGPAAGVVGAGASAASASEHSGLVTFDMGGTSTDVSLLRDGDAELTTDASIGGRPIATPMVDVETVGSGGGSIAWIEEGGALRVGPESAGAQPGPACYDRGGTRPTVTDAQVVLGYVGEEAELGGELSIDADAAESVMADLADEAGYDSPVDAARGVYRVANATMTRAVRSVTVERGHDPRSFGLVAFGGAGPVHATAIAKRLSIDRVILPLAGGVLSAYGLLAADEVHTTERTRRVGLSGVDESAIEGLYDEIQREAIDAATASPTVERLADCRYTGQSFELRVPVSEPFDPDDLRDRFQAAHERSYGYRMDEPVELVTLRCRAVVERTAPDLPYEGEGDAERGRRTVHFPDSTTTARVYVRRALSTDAVVEGPAVIEDTESTALVPPGWAGRVIENGTLVLERAADSSGTVPDGGDHRG